MGMFSFFRGKKEKVPEFNPTEDGGVGIEPSFRRESQPEFPSFQPEVSVGVTPRDIDLILSRLEIINRKLDDIDRRVKVIENIAKESQ